MCYSCTKLLNYSNIIRYRGSPLKDKSVGNTVKLVYPALDYPESSVNQKFTEAHNISLFQLLTALSTHSGNLKCSLIKKNYWIYLHKQRVKITAAKPVTVCRVCFFRRHTI
jgi:hypothetical protein